MITEKVSPFLPKTEMPFSTSIVYTWANSASPLIARFSRINWALRGCFSMKTQRAAPRLRASMPRTPEPAKRSKKPDRLSWNLKC